MLFPTLIDELAASSVVHVIVAVVLVEALVLEEIVGAVVSTVNVLFVAAKSQLLELSHA